MDLSKYEVEVRHHVFVSKGSRRTIICVGQIVGTKIKIFTIEEGN